MPEKRCGLRNRILVAAAAIPVILFTVFERYTSGWPFLAFLLVAGLLSALEYLDLVGEGFTRYTRAVSAASTVLMIILWFAFRFSFSSVPALVLLMPVLVFVPLLLLFVGVVGRSSFVDAFREVALAFLSVIWIGIGFGTLLALRGFSAKGPWLVFYAFLVVWLTDSFALFTGKLCGRHKLGLAASPNKTVEGAVGGILAAQAGAVILKLAVPGVFSGALLFHWPVLLAVTFFLSILGQLGDLAESVLKRSLGVKDSGGVVPGHGGLLDVFDAQLVVSPVLYLLVVVFS